DRPGESFSSLYLHSETGPLSLIYESRILFMYSGVPAGLKTWYNIHYGGNKMNLPAAFEDKMIKLLDEEEHRRYLDCFDEPRHYGLRVNTAKIPVEDLAKIGPGPLTPEPGIRTGFY